MNDWGKYGRAYENIAENLAGLAEINRVICLFPPLGINKNKNRRFEFEVLANKNGKLFAINLYSDILSFKKRPFRRISNIINDYLGKMLFKRLLKKMKLENENNIVWLFPPHKFINTILKKMRYDFMVTQIVDNNVYMTNISPQNKKYYEEQYRYLAKISDAVITSSVANHKMFLEYNQKSQIFENAVDLKFIREPSDLPWRLNRSRPRLGYVGFVSQRTDLKLLEYIADKRPEYDLILAGPISGDREKEFNELLKMPNIIYLGEIAYLEVPPFIQSLDVCLIPHLDSPYSRTMSPLKLYQYLGSGRPIVSTAVAGVERFKEIISVASNQEDYLVRIDETLKEIGEENKRKRIAAAKEETWEKRTESIWSYVIKEIQNKKEKENTPF